MALTDVIIIGAGQAGLAAAYYCKKQQLRFAIVDGSKRIGDSWRNRYDSLVLFTPRRWNSLPGLPFPGLPGGYPDKNEVANYLESYATFFNFPIQLETRVLKLEKQDNVFTVTTDRGQLHSSAVIIAAGAFQKAYTPKVRRSVSLIPEIHSSHYKNPTQIPHGNVLVIGSGNSAAQIAIDLHATHRVTLSLNKKLRFISNRGLTMRMSLLSALKVLDAPTNSWRGKVLHRSARGLVVGKSLKTLIKTGKVEVRPEIQEINGEKVIFKDGSTLTPRQIIWATGFKPDMNWVAIPGATQNGTPAQQAGVSLISGLYYVGQRWQSSVKSELLWGVSSDAQSVVTKLRSYLAQ
jgi:putative flavoprotein involved in K+ transport